MNDLHIGVASSKRSLSSSNSLEAPRGTSLYVFHISQLEMTALRALITTESFFPSFDDAMSDSGSDSFTEDDRRVTPTALFPSTKTFST